jgi:hypothetical protein
MNEHFEPQAEIVERSPHSRRNALITIGVLILIGIAAWFMTRGGDTPQGGPGGAGGPGRRGGRPSATVGTAPVAASDAPITLAAIGTVQPIVSATVRAAAFGQYLHDQLHRRPGRRQGAIARADRSPPLSPRACAGRGESGA